MALSSVHIPLQAFTHKDILLNNSPEQIGEDDTATIVYSGEIDNSGNTAAVYLKLYDSVGAPAVGTAVPEMVLKVAAGEKRPFTLMNSDGTAWTSPAGTTELWAACVTTGGTAGTTSPTNAVKATFHTD